MFKTYMGVAAGSGASKPEPVNGPKGAGPGGWEPSALYLGGLVLGEIVAVALLSRYLK